jgi:ribonuclease P protein component
MERRYRLTGSADFQRVRRTGKAYAHPLVILMACPNGLETTRIGVAAGRRVGSAVGRNRAKRLLREAIRPHVGRTHPGWDIVLIARPGLLTAPWASLTEAVADLMNRAGCLLKSYDDTD